MYYISWFCVFERQLFLVIQIHHHIFVSYFKLFIMRKIMILCAAFLLPLFTLDLRADDENAVLKIPLSIGKGNDLRRDISQCFISAYYYEMMSYIQTDITENLGKIDISVTNISTGEIWSDTINSKTDNQSILQISGSLGYYLIVYTTSSGDTIEGSFTIE